MPAQIRRKGGSAWIDVRLIFAFSVGKDAPDVGRLADALSISNRGIGLVNINPGDELRFAHGVIGEDGQRRWLVDPQQTSLVIADSDELTVMSEQLPPGNYKIGYVVSNLASNLEEQLTDVEVRADEEEAKQP